ncbi:MAG TPA: orotidine-5'-phosphate decarboxylase [Candidatus Angelobacter sp.]|jgi:orotidine 5'-phosphate decarboxylase subfamily 2|nr:orotidine-5'-phosphate decarboxylase [Candidatus Angelobacter sp.]
MRFHDRLRDAMERSGSLLCVGLDPDASLGTPAAVERFCLDVLDATLVHCAAVKPNLAFFEQFGPDGLRVLLRVRERVPSDRVLLLDAKRGDIGSTAEAYARALFDVLGADAVTVNPLMGGDTVEPWLRYAERGCGVFLLARTSNPGAADLLEQRLAGGEAVYEHIAHLAGQWDGGRGALGLVVGATAPPAIAALRARAPELPFLLPGVGAQGGSLEDALRAGVDATGFGALISVSRGIAGAAAGPGAAAAELHRRIVAARTPSTA